MVRSLIKSVASEPDGGWLDIVHLLPPQPRQLLNSFSLAFAPRRDCLWTSGNFWNQLPDDRFLDKEFLLGWLQTKAEPVTADDLRIGDLILFSDERGALVHSAVHIAGNIYFTKNGVSRLKPWVLWTYEDLLREYPLAPNITYLRATSTGPLPADTGREPIRRHP